MHQHSSSCWKRRQKKLFGAPKLNSWEPQVMVPCFSIYHEQDKDVGSLPRSMSVIEGLLIACLFFLLPSSQSFHLPGSMNTRLTDEQLRELTTDNSQPPLETLPILANLHNGCPPLPVPHVEQIMCWGNAGEMCTDSGEMFTCFSALLWPWV